MHDQEFERLYSKHAESLLAFLVYRTGDRMLSEDLLADTFERVLTTSRPFDRRKASETTWLYTIALNLLRDGARRAAVGQRAHERIAVGQPTSGRDPALDSIEDRDALQRALGTLSNEEREAIALRFGGDLTLPEVARLTRERLTTVEGRLYRALGKLKQELS